MSAAAIRKLITKTPGVCGGEACIGKRRITVWMLVNARHLGITDAELLKRYDPPLDSAELQAAWDYFAQHREEIEDAIRRNEEVA